MKFKNYIVFLKPVTKQNEFNKIQTRVKKEDENIRKVIKLIKDNLKVYSLEGELIAIDDYHKDGTEPPVSGPAISVKCTEKAIQRILQMGNILRIAEDSRYHSEAKLVKKAPRPKAPTFFELLFKKRRGR